MARKAALLSLLALFIAGFAAADTPHLLLDINSFATPLSSSPKALGRLGNDALFRIDALSATPGQVRSGLAKSDGTPEGAATLAIFEGAGPIYGSMTIGSRAFFDAEEDAVGDQLWVTDGTPSGTRRLTSFTPATTGAPLQLVAAFGADLLFARHVDGADYQLYRSDGTPEGTKLIAPITGYGSDSNTMDLAVVGNKIYFVATSDATSQTELWVSDGTAAGTQKVPAVSALDARVYITGLRAFNGGLVFFTSTDAYGGELTRLDASGAVSVIDLAAGPTSGIGGGVVIFNGYVYFAGTLTSGTDYELWRSDGTLAGTTLVKDIAPGTASGIDPQLGQFVQIGNRFVFAANDGSGVKLWGSDGTAVGTEPLTTALAFFSPDALERPVATTSLKYAYINAYLPGNKFTTIITDGTPSGTGLVPITNGGNPTQLLEGTGDATTEYVNIASVNQTTAVSTYSIYKFAPPDQFTLVTSYSAPGSYAFNGMGTGAFVYANGKLLFDGVDAAAGRELLVSDNSGTRLLSDFLPQVTTADSAPAWFTDWNGQSVFVANDHDHGSELWISDGTAAGTRLLVDLSPGAASSSPRLLSVWNGALYFFAYNGTAYHLMRLTAPDATPEALATVNPPLRVGDTVPEPARCYVPNAVGLGSKLIFTARTANAGTELWATDGTAAGTAMVADINTNTYFNGPPEGSQPCNLTLFQSRVYFSANTNASDITATSLWSTDGTSAGTAPFGNLTTASNGFVVDNNELYFAATDATGSLGLQTWRTNGTVAGTRPLVSAASASNTFAGLPVGVTNGKLILSVSTPPASPTDNFTYALWASENGSAPVLVSSFPLIGGLLAKSDHLYFTNNPEGDEEPWISDGTAAGTHRLADLDSAGSSSPFRYMDFRGTVVIATNDTTGNHLWRTDGTESGTVQIGTLPDRYGLSTFGVAGQHLFFGARNELLGDELYVLANEAPAAVADTASATNGQAVTVSVLANDADPDGSLDISSTRVVQAPAHGSTSVASNGTVTYTPAAGYSGNDTFTYTVADKQGYASNAATVTLTVTAAPPSNGGSGGSNAGASSGGKGGGGPLRWYDVLVLAALAAWRLGKNFRAGDSAPHDRRAPHTRVC